MSIGSTPPQRGDRPWWSAALTVLAVLPGVLALLVLWSVRRLTRGITSARRQLMPFKLPGGSARRSFGAGRLLLAGSLGGVLGYRLGRRHATTEHTALRLRTATGEVHCRFASPPGALPLAAGDTAAVWGRLHPDGTLRGRRVENRTTGVTHRARVVSWWVPLAAFASLVLCVLAFSSIARFHVI